MIRRGQWPLDRELGVKHRVQALDECLVTQMWQDGSPLTKLSEIRLESYNGAVPGADLALSIRAGFRRQGKSFLGRISLRHVQFHICFLRVTNQ